MICRKGLLLLSICALCLTACATPPNDPIARAEWEAMNDPLEPMNRVTHDFNMFVNNYVFRPFLKAYRFILPEPVRTGVKNFSLNIQQPVILVNALLQLDFEGVAQSFGRFTTNTTLGVFGIFDVASKFNIEAPNKDFGQTMYTWGIKPEGPYLVVPILGPSNFRDASGMAINFFIDPIEWSLPRGERYLLWYRYGVVGLVGVDNTTDLLYNVDKTSADPYAYLRTMYQQNRRNFLEGKKQIEKTGKASYEFEFDIDDE